MAILEEKEPRIVTAILLLALLFALTYPLWHLGGRELFGMEGESAVAVTEMQAFPPRLTVHGLQPAESHPFHLLLVKAAVLCGLPMEVALRLISVLAYFLLTALVFYISWKNGDRQSACAAAAVMFTTAVVQDKLPEGYPTAVTALLIYGGWMVWIEAWLGRNNWDLAWVLGGLFGGLIYCNAGFTGLVYFLVPLAMQRRPLTVWPKLRRWGFYTGAVIVLLFVLAAKLPQWDVPAVPRAWIEHFSAGEYLWGLLVFPFNSFLRLLPWSLLLWAPFCAALIPLDENPLFGKFHRILFLTLLILIWLNPASQARDLFYLMPLAAVMIGANYRILMRRYGEKILPLCRIAAWTALVFALFAALYYFIDADLIETWAARVRLDLEHPLAFKNVPAIRIYALCEIAAAAVCASFLLLTVRLRKPVWLSVALAFCSFSLLIYATAAPYRAQERPKHRFADSLARALGKEKLSSSADVIYTNIYGLFPELYYTGFQVKSIEPRDLPKNEKTVYMITLDVPDNTDRRWDQIFDTEYKDTRFFIYRGKELIEYDDEP